MTAATYPGFHLPQRLPTDPETAAQLRAALNRLFARRTRVALATLLGGMALFSVADLFTHPSGGWQLLELRGVSAGLIAVGYALVSQRRLLPYAPALAWLVFTTGCALVAFAGTLSDVASAASPILCVVLALAAGALFPWGAGVQLAAASAAGSAFSYTVYWMHSADHPIITYQGAEGVVVCLLSSVVCAFEARARVLAVMRDTVERRRAEEALLESNQRLDRRVRTRIAEIEAAKRHLAQQIAENRAVAKTIEESENLLRAIIDNSSALIYVRGLDGRYTLANEQHARLFGYPCNEIIGKAPYDLFPADAAATVLANDQQVLATNRPVQFEETVLWKGELRTFLSTKFAVRDPGGVIYGICGISTDITERRRMESALRHSRATLSALIDNSDEGIWALDREYRIQLLNAVARQRFPRAYGTHPHIGTDFRSVLPAAVRPEWNARVDQALAGQRIVAETSVTTDGEMHQFLVSLNPIIEATSVMGVTIFVKDITPLKRAEEQLRQHEAELAQVLRRNTMGELAAELAHEINQPLGAIANYSQGCTRRVQSGDYDLAEFRDAIDQIASEAERAGGVLDRLQNTILPVPTRNQPIDVNHLIRAAVRAVEFRHSAIGLQLRLAEELPPGHGDTIQVEQVVLNLLHNAIDALQGVPPESRQLVVETRLAEAGSIEVAVRDTGPGLDATVADKVFQPFITTKSHGLGMGLAICRGIVEAHDGRLWVTSERGRGCTFHFTLPASDTASAGPRVPTS